MNSFESRPRHTTLLLGRLGLEPGCTRDDLEIRWLRMEEEAEATGQPIDSVSKECYRLLQDKRRWAGRSQGRKPAGIDQAVKLFLMEHGMLSLLSDSGVTQAMTGVTLETLTKLDRRALVDMGFSPRHRYLLDLALGRTESPAQALSLLLQEAGLTSYDQVLQSNFIDIHTLGLLNSSDLDEMGFRDPVLRRKIEGLLEPAPGMGVESGGGGKDDSGYDEEGGADDQDYPVLRLLGQLDGNTELDNALSMIADMHEERVDVVSRVCHEVLAERMESCALRRRVDELEGELSLRRYLEVGKGHSDVDSCVSAIIAAGLAMPPEGIHARGEGEGGGGGAGGIDEAVVADACARALGALCDGKALRAWQETALLQGAQQGAYRQHVDRVDRVRDMVARVLAGRGH